MAGKEKKCTKYAIIEFSFNIVLSLIALHFFDMAVMALLRLFSSVGINFFGIMKTTGRKLDVTLKDYYLSCCRRTILFSPIPLLYLLYFSYDTEPLEWTILKFILVSLSYGCLFLFIATYFILEKSDKEFIINRFPKSEKTFPGLSV